MSNKEIYRKFCKSNKQLSIFLTDWWMDAVCGEENWDVAIVDNHGDVLASLVYYTTKDKLGFRGISQPILTPYTGLFIKYPDNQKYNTKVNFEKKLITQLISQIESQKLAFFHQQQHPALQNWLPFYWQNYTQATRYTYVIHDLSDMEKLYQSFDSTIKINIRKAQEILQVKTDCDVETFYRINKLSFDRQNKKIPYSQQQLDRIFTACAERNCGKNFYAIDKEGNIHGAIYMIWDETSAYYLLAGGDPALRNSGSNVLLLWEALQFISKINPKLCFDFEGSMLEPVEHFIRSFGGIQQPYFLLKKDYSKTYHFLKTMQGLLS